jgi:hypothetical protein
MSGRHFAAELAGCMRGFRISNVEQGILKSQVRKRRRASPVHDSEFLVRDSRFVPGKWHRFATCSVRRGGGANAFQPGKSPLPSIPRGLAGAVRSGERQSLRSHRLQTCATFFGEGLSPQNKAKTRCFGPSARKDAKRPGTLEGRERQDALVLGAPETPARQDALGFSTPEGRTRKDAKRPDTSEGRECRDALGFDLPEAPTRQDALGSDATETPTCRDALGFGVPETPTCRDALGFGVPETPMCRDALGFSVPETPTRRDALAGGRAAGAPASVVTPTSLRKTRGRNEATQPAPDRALRTRLPTVAALARASALPSKGGRP